MFLRLIFLATLLLFSTPLYAGQAAYKDIPYLKGIEFNQQMLDIYTPDAEVKAKSPRPVLIFVHGGSWRNGDKGTVLPQDAKLYTDRGIIVVSVNYRLTPPYKHPIHVKDCADAVKWVKDNISKYDGDAENMILSGHSAGAQLVALLGTNPKYLNDVGLPLDMFRAIVPVDTASFDLTTPLEGTGALFVAGRIERAFGSDPAVLREASPTLQVRGDDVKMSPFVIYVTAKRESAVQQGNLFKEALQKNNHYVEAYALDKNLSHRDMKLAIFDETSPIFAKIVDTLASGM